MLLTNLLGADQCLFAQDDSSYTYQISYGMLLNFNGYQVYRAELYTGDSGSLFFYQIENKSENNEPIPGGSDADEFQFDIVDTTRFFILSDRVGNRIHQLERIPAANALCVVLEPFESIEWIITGQKKVIDSFECEEARGSFRGRDYTVWFTDALPFSFGPWKLHGLPGLIMEAHDATSEVQFVVSAVRIIDANSHIPVPTIHEYPVLDRKTYAEKFKRYIDELERRLMSRFDRSFRVNINSSLIKSVEIYDY